MQKLGNSLAVRLTIWFLLLSFFPLGVMAVFVRGNVMSSVTNLTAGHQQYHAAALASSIVATGEPDIVIDKEVQDMVTSFGKLGRYAFVVSKNGEYLAHSDEGRVGDRMSDDFSSQALERLQAGEQQGTFVDKDAGLLLGYVAIPDSELTVVAVGDEGEISPLMADLESSSSIQLTVSLIVVSVAGGVIIWVVVGKPIRQLTLMAEQVGAGNLEVKVNPDDMEDELKVLAHTFNQMTKQLRLMVGNLERHISELQQAEVALQESEERFRSFVQNVPVGVFRTTPGLEGKFLMTNPALVKMFGFESSSALEKIHPADLYQDPNDRKRFSDTLLVQGSVTAMEIRFKTQDDSSFWGAISARTMFDQEGKIAFFDGILNDITGRKQAQEALEKRERQFQEQARQLQHIMDTVPEGMLLLNTEGQVLLANPLAQQSLKILADAQVGDTLVQLGNLPLHEIFAKPPDGLWHEVNAGEFIFEVVARPMFDGPEKSDWVLVLNNVTQEREIRKRLEQQERLAAVGQLATGIAHDFRNLLSTIILYAQMAGRADGMSERTRQQMIIIDERAKHATRLIQQILDFSRRSVLERQPLDLIILLKEEVELLRRTLPEDIEVKLAYDKGDFTVNADPTRMRQMITNLAVNARDAMPKGGRLEINVNRVEMCPSGTLSALPTIKPGKYIRLSISDTGSGIPADALPHIFEPFFTTKEPGVGTGLGLAQVYGIVGQHEGHVEVETQEEEGTEFNIFLPCLSSQADESKTSETLSEMTKGSGELILVVEDELAVRLAVVESLRWMNYQVLQAADGGEALSILTEKGNRVQLILSDVVMPEMGGIALFHAVREQELNIPVILLTGHPKETELEVLQEQGLAGWLLKPPNMEQLAQMVAQAITEK